MIDRSTDPSWQALPKSCGKRRNRYTVFIIDVRSRNWNPLHMLDKKGDIAKARIHETIDSAIQSLADTTGLCVEEVADIAFLRLQKHPDWARNATKRQKRLAFAHWHGHCYRCDKPVLFDEAHFHHLKCRIPNQHGATNLVPLHIVCHDSEHNVSNGSLSKGSPNKQSRPTGEADMLAE